MSSIVENAAQAASLISDYRGIIDNTATSVDIPEGATSIRPYAFCSCSNLTSITIPDRVTSMGNSAFNSSGLVTITIPNSITSIGSYAFLNCSSLEFVTLEHGFNAQNLNLSASTLYTAQTIVGWLNALADRTGLTAYTLTIGATNLNKLTAEQKAIATNKNWNLA